MHFNSATQIGPGWLDFKYSVRAEAGKAVHGLSLLLWKGLGRCFGKK